jgi:tryptophan-rich sensory protein
VKPATRAVAVAAAAALFVAMLGATVTDLGPWYRGLAKPSWQPPDFAFPVGWTAIYAMTAISGLIAWRAAVDPTRRAWTIALYAFNGFLNVLWSLLFFRLKRPDWALGEVAFLFASIAVMMVFVWPRSRLAVLLLLPYLVWVAFAGALNLAVVQLNAPF